MKLTNNIKIVDHNTKHNTMSQKLWIDKYRPKKSSKLIGNKKAINIINDWFVNVDKGDKKNLIVIGPCGIGKKTIINVLLEQFGYNYQELNFSKVDNNKGIKDYINSLINGSDISNHMNKNIKHKNAIVGNIDIITSPTEKRSILELIKNNKKYKYLPIILISSQKYTKFLGNLKKTCCAVNMYPLYNSDLLKLMNKIIKKEKIKINDESIKNQIIDHTQGDIRRLVNVLQDINFSYQNIAIDKNILNEYINDSNKKDIDLGLFDNTKQLLNNYESIDESILLYNTEKNKLPSMIHEHYIDHINNKFVKPHQKLEAIKKISESISYGDFIEYHIYDEQNWDMQDFHGFYTCAATSFYLNYYKKIKKFEKLRYPDYINKKNISNVENNFIHPNAYDYIQMNKIIKYLLKKNNISEIADKLKGYNLNIDQIESLLKIDKILKSKNTPLPANIKKKLNGMI